MNQPIGERLGWHNGNWGSLSELTIPIDDRGLNLGDGIFETILILEGKPQLLLQHLERWRRSAILLGMASPPNELWLQPLIAEGLELAGLNKGNGSLRLNWSRGHQSIRGISLSNEKPNPSNHSFWLEFNIQDPCFKPISAIISRHEQRNENSLLSRCKTFAYGQAIQARREAHLHNYDDALLGNTNGELCCATTANILVLRNHELLTPRAASGCLPGIMRNQGLKLDVLKEAKLEVEPQANDEWLLINSLGCHPIHKLNNKNLSIHTHPEQLWRSLLNE